MDDENLIQIDSEEKETTFMAASTPGFSLVALCNFLASFTSFFFFVVMLLNRKIRSNPYDFYIIWLIFPDALNTILIGLKYTFFSVNQEILMPTGFYEVRIFVYFFYFVTNFYLNAIVAYEVNTLADGSYHRRKVQPPTMAKVYKQVGGIYLFAILVGLWAILPVSWSIFHFEDATRAKTILGSGPSGVISQGTAMIIFGGFVLIPHSYVFYVRIRIAVKKLLPKEGRTRVLSLFLMRILVVFVVFYIPSTALSTAFIGNNSKGDTSLYYWMQIVIGILTACQAAVTVYMVSLKDDIRQAVHETFPKIFKPFCCRPIGSSNGRESRISVSGLSPQIRNKWNMSDEYSFKIDLDSSSVAPEHNVSAPPSQDNMAASQNIMQSEWEQEDVYEAKDQQEEEPAIGDVENPAAKEESHSQASSGTSRASVDKTGAIKDDETSSTMTN